MDSRKTGNEWEDMDMFGTTAPTGFDTPSGFDAFNDFTNLDAQYAESPIGLALRTPSKSGPDASTSAAAQHANGGAALAMTSAETSSQDSSSDTSSGRKRKTGQSESPVSMDDSMHHHIKQEDSKMDMQQVRSYDHFSQPMHNLSLEQQQSQNNMGQQYFNSAASSPVHASDFNSAMSLDAQVAGNMAVQYQQDSPVQTINPGMFSIGGSRDQSPATNLMFNQASPTAMFSTPSSDSPEAFANTQNWPASLAQNPQWPGDFAGQLTSPGGIAFTPSPGANGATPASTTRGAASRALLGRSPLHIAPISTKSRVETQINVVMTLEKPPPGIEHLHLPLHTIAKSKLLAKEEFDPTKVLELHTMLVCTSAMHNPQTKEKALKRAAAQNNAEIQRRAELARDVPHDEDRNDQKNLPEDERVVNGGEVKICNNCIQRERKRAGRKKTKREEEQQHWERFETERVVVFNSNEYLPFKPCDPSQYPQRDTNADGEQYMPPDGALHVTAAMRIACYCRHQSEKEGFQVIFTLKDHQGNVVAQQLSDSILITDDHKTHPQSFSATVGNEGFYQNAAFLPNGLPMSHSMVDMSAHVQPFTSSRSAGNLPALAYNAQYNPHSHVHQLPGSGYASGTTSATMTPTSLSRPGSPTNAGQAGPNKKRKSSSFHRKVPSGLTMTPRVDTSQPPSSNMPSAVSMNTPFSPTGQFPVNQSYMTIPNNNGPAQYYNSGPPTPNENAPFNFSQPQVDMSRIQQNLNNQAYFSHPSSAVPSRASSPVLQQTRANMAAYARQHPIQTSTNTMGNRAQQQQQFAVQVPPGSAGHDGTMSSYPTIDRITPNEGPMSGGTEVAIFGHNFVNGVQVQFGDQVVSSQVLSPNSMITISPPGRVGSVHLNLLAPPGAAPYPQLANRPIFRYTQYNEQMMVMALKYLSEQQYGQTDNWQALAQQSATQYVQSNVVRGGLGQQGTYRMAAEYGDVEGAIMQISGALDQHRPASTLASSHASASDDASSLGIHHEAERLVGRGASLTCSDNNGYAPSLHAALQGHREIFERLAAPNGLPYLRGPHGSDMQATTRTRLLRYTEHLRGVRRYSGSSRSSIDDEGKPLSRASKTDGSNTHVAEMQDKAGQHIALSSSRSRQMGIVPVPIAHVQSVPSATDRALCRDNSPAQAQETAANADSQSQAPPNVPESSSHHCCTSFANAAASPKGRRLSRTATPATLTDLLTASDPACAAPAYHSMLSEQTPAELPRTIAPSNLDTVAGQKCATMFETPSATDHVSRCSGSSEDPSPNMSAETLRWLVTTGTWVPGYALTTTSIMIHAILPHIRPSITDMSGSMAIANLPGASSVVCAAA
ncbi:hypothetical protein CB0940_02446 [Cercospora beticola]|uniref:IPT/TIG domain-containing protein n=1 Tax=Cercospora beticola TaxID=122368 RepID=A0A2G5I304_CERBT|nr:hypothetical protein CB0940_02446 [Cercospora beticola]PIA98873.1 hypothetical protein CB0940_02446 [Cercospora beticola]WPA99580.1 hypothetical protein RHO25_004198 [Cercospora beticola]